MKLRALARRIQRLERVGPPTPGGIRIGRGMAGLRAALERLDGLTAARELPRQPPDASAGLLAARAGDDGAGDDGPEGDTDAATAEPHADAAHG
ncbi:hypothetical protein LG047_00520 [Methylocystis sp. WRRC1]|uniref:hypothetical protein n=1 Tax=Methylocystis sp. WRRC1 TaxID=1732014 RepID=UPI001D137954|nr:hypothetical protein [Methylocystis sp. WRRC1]MCC3243820.1 hypothetical protein [Methylocystis sp. WRRC1]